MEKQRSRAWCLTINNYTDEQFEDVKSYISTADYGIVGKEEGEECHTPHLQIYFRLKNATTFSALKKRFPTAHIEIAKGNDLVNQEYCSKGLNFIVVGKPSQQGKRTDLDEIKNEIMEGKKVDDIVLENPMLYHNYGRTLHKIEDLRMRKIFRKEMTKGYWIWGETGCGKSEYAFNFFNPDSCYKWNYDGGWNDDYAQQETVIIDEFRGQMPMNELLTMIDKHPNYSVRRRNRPPLPFVSKKVIITSSMPPQEVYRNLSDNDKLEQLFRRIKIIKLEEEIIPLYFQKLFSK